MIPIRYQPDDDFWDRVDAEWWSTDDADAISASMAHDGAWLVRLGCIDCRIAYYADEEFMPMADPPPCPGCGGHRWRTWVLPMERRAMQFVAHGLPPVGFGVVRLDFREELPS